MAESRKRQVARWLRQLRRVCAITTALAAGPAWAEVKLSAPCSAWSRSYTMHSSGTSSVMLPTEDGGIILVGDLGKIEFGTNIMVPDDWRVVAVRFDGCGNVQYAVPVGPKESAVEVASLDAAGTLYVAAAATGGHSWVAKVRDGHQLWLRQYPSRHSGIVGLHPGGDGSVAMLADVSTGLTVGDRTFVDPETADGSVITPAMPFLIVIDAEGRMTYSEQFNRGKRFLFNSHERFYLVTHLGTTPGSGAPDDIDARSSEGRRIWHLKLDIGGQVAVNPKGGLVQFADTYVDCGRAWYDCPLERRERVAIDETGKIGSWLVVEGSGKTPVSPATARRLRSPKLRGPLKEGLSQGRVYGVDQDGRALLDDRRSAGYTVIDEKGQIADFGTVPGLHPSRDRGVGYDLRWSSDGSAFAFYFKGKNPMTFHLVKWAPRHNVEKHQRGERTSTRLLLRSHGRSKSSHRLWPPPR